MTDFYEQLNDKYKLRYLEHKLRMSESAVEFWTNVEQVARTETKFGSGANHHSYIAYTKHKRKEAQADVIYWASQIEALLKKDS